MIMLYTGMYDHYAGGNLSRALPYLVAVTSIYLVIAGLIGSAWGGSDKAKRLRINAIEEHNMQFLDVNVFQDSGLEDDIIEDADGNRLKLKEEQEGRMVFSVVGRRNVRAVITLDEEGRMVDYTRAVNL